MSEREIPQILSQEQINALDRFVQVTSQITKNDVIAFLRGDDILNVDFAKNRIAAILDLDDDDEDLDSLKMVAALHRITPEERQLIKSARYYIGIHDIANKFTTYSALFQMIPPRKKI